MTDLNYQGHSLYYRHSGRFSSARILPALLASCLAACLAATVYAYIICYTPIGGYISILFTLGCGFAIAYPLARLLRWAQVRNTAFAVSIAAFVGLLALYAAWVVYLYAKFIQLAHHNAHIRPLPFWNIIIRPRGEWRLIRAIGEHGVWKLGEIQPSGIALWIIWIIEAILIVGFPVRWTYKKIREVPFCETCKKWGKTKTLIPLSPANPAELRAAMEQKNFAHLENLGLSRQAESTWYDLALQGCPDCDTTQTLTIDQITLTPQRNGKNKRASVSILRQLRLTPEETAEVALTAAKIQAPSSPPPIVTPKPSDP